MATKQGNRRLQATIYFFAVQMIQISSKGTPIQLFVRITRSVKKKVNQYYIWNVKKWYGVPTASSGKRFGHGLFNSFSKDNVKKWTEIVSEAYPEFQNLFKIFGYDWLGRCFGIDLRKSTYGNILMFEIGTNDVLEIPCTFDKFLNEEIPLYADVC